MLVDFHMHSTVSDGVLSPVDLVLEGRAKSISYLSITDHDEVDAYTQLKKTPVEGVHVIHGCEFSTTYEGTEVHILGYAFDIAHKEIKEYVAHHKHMREERVKQMIQNCQREGYQISYDELRHEFPYARSLGRPHIAQLLVNHGYVQTVKEAFKTVLHHKGTCFVPKERCTPKNAIDLIHTAGGLAVLAHPRLIRNDAYVKELLQLSFDGIEAYHSSHSKEESRYYEVLGQSRGLLISGGSDFHGITGRYPESLGIYEVTYDMIHKFIHAVTTA